METSTVAILLYSKYSQRCKEFLDEADDELGLRVLCIDNNEIREMITKDKNGYHIKNVPCVFVLYSNGRLEKYEGSDAFVWLRKVKDVLKTSPSDTQTQPHQQQQPQQQQQIDMNNGGDVDENDPDDPQKRTEALIEKELSMRQSADQMLSRKTLNIKEVAQMMQQQRETDEERMNPPPPGGPLRS